MKSFKEIGDVVENGLEDLRETASSAVAQGRRVVSFKLILALSV